MSNAFKLNPPRFPNFGLKMVFKRDLNEFSPNDGQSVFSLMGTCHVSNLFSISFFLTGNNLYLKYSFLLSFVLDCISSEHSLLIYRDKVGLSVLDSRLSMKPTSIPFVHHL